MSNRVSLHLTVSECIFILKYISILLREIFTLSTNFEQIRAQIFLYFSSILYKNI